VAAALDDVENDVPTVPPADDTARRTLEADVTRALDQRLRDPVPRALLSRPKILRWCLDQMGAPATAPRVIAPRVVAVVLDEWAPRFAAALARQVSSAHNLSITDAEVEDVAGQLEAGSAGRPVAELDVIVAQILARRRGAAAMQETLDPLGERGRQAATRGRPAARPAAPAVSVDPAARWSSWNNEPCAIAGVAVDVPDLHDVDDLTSDEEVLAAAVLATVYQAGDRMQAFLAVSAAVKQLDSATDELCIDDPCLLNALSCWYERTYRVRAPERAALAAKILGLNDPELPEGVEPDPYIQPMLNDLLDAINATCDPGFHRPDPNAVRLAAQRARARISSSITRAAIMKITQLQVQYEQAQDILAGLVPFVRGHCRPRSGAAEVTGIDSEWFAVAALLGDRLPDGTDLLSAHATATAWRTIFLWLADSTCIVAPVDDDLCAAASLLRPRRYGRWGCCDRGGKH
jgi:hypothetical protein